MTATTISTTRAGLPDLDAGRAKAFLPANELRRLLTAVLPHLDRNIDLLSGVELTVTPGRVTVCATDRFTLGAAFADAQTTGTWRGTLPGTFAAAVQRALPRVRKHGTEDVVLDLAGHSVTVSPPPSPTGTLTTLADTTTGIGFPDWRTMVAKTLDAQASAEPFALNPAKMPYWRHLDEFGPVQVIATGPGRPVLLLAEKAMGLIGALRGSDTDRRSPAALREVWRNAVVPW